MTEIGKRVWVIPEGYIPSGSTGPAPELTSHEAACILNAGRQDTSIEVTVYFENRQPVGPYTLTVPAERTLHLRFNDLVEPEPIPRDTPFATVIRSARPVVVQHTRLDSRQPENALMTTIAFGAD